VSSADVITSAWHVWLLVWHDVLCCKQLTWCASCMWTGMQAQHVRTYQKVAIWMEQHDSSAASWSRPLRPCPHLPGVWELQGRAQGRPVSQPGQASQSVVGHYQLPGQAMGAGDGQRLTGWTVWRQLSIYMCHAARGRSADHLDGGQGCRCTHVDAGWSRCECQPGCPAGHCPGMPWH
jgi:hypothetical protein